MLKTSAVKFVEDVRGNDFHRVNFILKSQTGPSWDITVTADADGYEGTMVEVGSKETPFSLWGRDTSELNKMIFAVLDSQEEHQKGQYRDLRSTYKITNPSEYKKVEDDFRLMRQDVIAGISKVFQVYERPVSRSL